MSHTVLYDLEGKSQADAALDLLGEVWRIATYPQLGMLDLTGSYPNGLSDIPESVWTRARDIFNRLESDIQHQIAVKLVALWTGSENDLMEYISDVQNSLRDFLTSAYEAASSSISAQGDHPFTMESVLADISQWWATGAIRYSINIPGSLEKALDLLDDEGVLWMDMGPRFQNAVEGFFVLRIGDVMVIVRRSSRYAQRAAIAEARGMVMGMDDGAGIVVPIVGGEDIFEAIFASE